MSQHLALKTQSLIYSFLLCTLAYGQTPLLQWDRDSAMAAAHSVNIDAAVHELSDISSLANADITLERLAVLESRTDWPLPAREAVLLQFTQNLADLPRDAIAVAVIQHLKNYQARTLVPHEDHGSSFVPLFNIRGAAAGVENAWQRADYEAEAFAMLGEDPAKFVVGYLATTEKNQRSGYSDALQQASFSDVVTVQEIVLERLEQEPALSGILQTSAVITSDTGAAQQLLAHGRGAGLSSALAELDRQLPRSEIASLLSWAIQQAPTTNAALAIAAWWPGLSHDHHVRELMMDTLSDPALGTSAALALSQDPDIQTIKALQETASGDSAASARAQMALDLNRDGLSGGFGHE